MDRSIVLTRGCGVGGHLDTLCAAANQVGVDSRRVNQRKSRRSKGLRGLDSPLQQPPKANQKANQKNESDRRLIAATMAICVHRHPGMERGNGWQWPFGPKSEKTGFRSKNGPSVAGSNVAKSIQSTPCEFGLLPGRPIFGNLNSMVGQLLLNPEPNNRGAYASPLARTLNPEPRLY